MKGTLIGITITFLPIAWLTGSVPQEQKPGILLILILKVLSMAIRIWPSFIMVVVLIVFFARTGTGGTD